MWNVLLTPEGIAAIVGFMLMVFFAYVPVVRQKWAVLASEVKSWIMLGLLLLAELVICLMSIYPVGNPILVTVPPFEIATALKVALALLVANQPTYQLFPPAADVKALVLARDAKLALNLVENPVDPNLK